MDCTYKTNKYKMPLLDIIGVSSFNIIEVQDDWNSFLSLWNEVIYSSSEVEYVETWKLFELTYREKKDAISYIEKTWLPLREHFVSAWTEKYLHFANRVSSRAEAAHAKLKRYLQVSTCDFRQIKDKISLAVDNEFQEIKAQLSREKLQVPHYCNFLFFKELISHVSNFAMRELHKQYEMIKHGTMQPSCKGHFMATMGLPCAHKMMNWIGGQIPLDVIHPQWRIDTKSLSCIVENNDNNYELKDIFTELHDKYQQWPIIQKEHAQEILSQLVSSSTSLYLEPAIQPHKGRPIGATSKNSSSTTRRDPSSFEMVEKSRKCSICKDVGHNSRTCKGKSTNI